MKTCVRKMALVLSMMCIVAFASPITLFAGSLDDLSGDSRTNNSSNSDSSHNTEDEKAISDWLKNRTPVTNDNMEKASSMASPIVNALGTFSGFVIMIVSAGIFAITALDLAYIGIPPLRSVLNPQLSMGAQGGGMPMGGMGMGMRGGMMGGMMGGMGAMGGAQGAMPEQGLRRKWVSDEAVACVNLANMQSQQGTGAPMGGMPMGGMMGGMSAMGGMGAMGGAPQPMPTKSIIFEYLKKRSFFIIIFTVATVVLMSSLFTDCGLNLAELLSKIVDKFNGQLSNVDI